LFAEGDTLAEQMERGSSEEWLRPMMVLLSLCCEMPGSLLSVAVADLRAWTMRLDWTNGCFFGVEKSSAEVSDSVPENDLADRLLLSVPQAGIVLHNCCSKACR
jgi:hypothetical protein